MQSPNTLSSQLCAFEDFEPYLPSPISRARVCYLADNGKFPPYVRESGGYSKPLWRRDAVAAWYKDTYGDLIPDHVADFEQRFMKPTKSESHSRSRVRARSGTE